MNLNELGFIGYGEVGKIFSASLKDRAGVVSVSAWDLKFAAPTTRAVERERAYVLERLLASLSSRVGFVHVFIFSKQCVGHRLDGEQFLLDCTLTPLFHGI